MLGAAFQLPAYAALSDTITPFLQTSIAYDDNLLRLSEGSVGTDGSLSDTVKTVAGGILFNRPIGRQVIAGHANLSKVTFDRNDQLDYSGKDLLIDWNWQLGNHLRGSLDSSYVETLTPFADSHSNERNLSTKRGNYFESIWQLHPSWQVRGKVGQSKSDFELETQRRNDRTDKLLEAGVDYTPSSGSRIGFQVSRRRYEYDNLRVSNGILIDSGYDQEEAKINILWKASGRTEVTFLGGWARRKHNQLVNRDDSGPNGRLDITWSPLGKLKFTGAAWREFAVVEGDVVGSSINKGASLGSIWTVTAKTSFNAMLRTQKREFTTAEGFVTPLGLSDSSKSASAGINYSPLMNVQLQLSAFHAERDGSPIVGTNSYKSNGASFSVNAQF